MSEERSLTVPSCAQGGKLSYAIFTLARAHRSYAAELLRELGLHPGQELLLMQLLDRDGQTQSELLDSVGLDTPRCLNHWGDGGSWVWSLERRTKRTSVYCESISPGKGSR